MVEKEKEEDNRVDWRTKHICVSVSAWCVFHGNMFAKNWTVLKWGEGSSTKTRAKKSSALVMFSTRKFFNFPSNSLQNVKRSLSLWMRWQMNNNEKNIWKSSAAELQELLSLNADVIFGVVVSSAANLNEWQTRTQFRAMHMITAAGVCHVQCGSLLSSFC